jgi:cobalt-zinc-cadmium efflux system outer membrane protein
MLKHLGRAGCLAISLTGLVGGQAIRLPPQPTPPPRTARLVANNQAAETPLAMPPSVAGPLQPPPALTLDELEALALAGNPSIVRGEALVSAARGNWLQVGLPPNPIAGYEGQQIGSGGRAEQDGIFFGQEFVRGGKLRLNREVAAQEVSRAEQNLAAQRQRVLTDVRIAYYAVLISERQERLAAEILRIAQEGVKTAETLLKAMEVGRGDLLQSQLELETASILVQNARNRRTAAWQALAAVTGQAQLTARPLAGDVEEDRRAATYDEISARLLGESPEIAVAVANLERARWVLQRARVEAVPNITVQGLVNWRDNGIGGGPDGAVTVGLPIPAWNRNQGAIRQAQCEVVAAEQALAQVELDLVNRLAPVYERYANARNQVERYRGKILPAAQESLELSRKLYAAGETGYVSLLTAQRTHSQTNLNYLESLRELRASESELAGLLLRGSLEQR